MNDRRVRDVVVTRVSPSPSLSSLCWLWCRVRVHELDLARRWCRARFASLLFLPLSSVCALGRSPPLRTIGNMQRLSSRVAPRALAHLSLCSNSNLFHPWQQMGCAVSKPATVPYHFSTPVKPPATSKPMSSYLTTSAPRLTLEAADEMASAAVKSANRGASRTSPCMCLMHLAHDCLEDYD